jgi:dsDNA-specific endonuclease/ATPase MutS2
MLRFIKWLQPKKREYKEDTEHLAESLEDIDPFNPFPEPVSIEITDVFDLHTISPKDVKRVTEEYLLEAYRAGFKSVRIIHGKGIGVQRKLVHTILAQTPFVDIWTDAPPDRGGWGATIIRFTSYSDEEEVNLSKPSS